MLPEDFEPDRKQWDNLCSELKIPETFLRDETEKFKAFYWGSGGTKLNWQQAWNFWIRKEVSSRRRGSGPELPIVRSNGHKERPAPIRPMEEGEGNPFEDLLRERGLIGDGPAPPPGAWRKAFSQRKESSDAEI
jgi:hypothetical protein